MKKILFFPLFLLQIFVFGQNWSADTNAIRIGEQLKLTLSIKTNQKEKIKWPNFQDTIVSGIEIIQQGKLDTSITNDIWTLSQDFIITAWDSGSYLIPSFAYLSDQHTEPFQLQVQSIQIDKNDPNPKDIKPLMDAPYGWADFWPYLLILVLILLAILLWKRIKNKKKKSVLPTEKIIPSDEKAMIRLYDLQSKKLWQKGEFKQYHTEISEILRNYIEERFLILAMEQPTPETITALKNKITDTDIALATNILSLSDLVKFAKHQPLPTENEQSMELAIKFVNNTKVFVSHE